MKFKYILSFVLVLNSLLFGATIIFAQQSPDTNKSTPIDSYPVPHPGVSRYALADKWDKTNLTYFIHNCPSTINCNQAHEAIRRAFRAWDGVSALTFVEVTNRNAADIELQWTVQENEFGEEGGTLAFAYFPTYGGDVFFDDAEPWTLYDGSEEDLYVVAVHEIGHSLGMDHTDDPNAVMFPYSGGKSDLASDDITGIQRLYGTGSPDDVIVEPDAPENLPQGRETVDGTIGSNSYYELWELDVEAGETVTLIMETTSGDLDAYLGVMTPDMEDVLIEDDDGHGGTDSRITFTFPTTAIYVVVATRYDLDEGTTAGDYRLTAIRDGDESAPPQPPPEEEIVELTITNYSGTTICGIWISPSSEDEWGEEWMSEDDIDQLDDGFFIRWEVEPDTYDVLVEDCFENSLEAYVINVTKSVELEVSDSEITTVR